MLENIWDAAHTREKHGAVRSGDARLKVRFLAADGWNTGRIQPSSGHCVMATAPPLLQPETEPGTPSYWEQWER